MGAGMDDLGYTARDPELAQGDRLLLRAFRLLALEIPCHGLQRQFEHACGCAGAEACRMLRVFVQQLSLCGRRPITLSAPAARRTTPDEVLILTVFAHAQGGDYLALDEGLAGLLAGPVVASMGAAACVIGEVFQMNGLVLRAPESAAAPRERPRLAAGAG
jgi:hypothetical protein